MTEKAELALVELLTRYVKSQEALAESSRIDVENKRVKDEKLQKTIEQMLSSLVKQYAPPAEALAVAADVSAFFSRLDHAFIESGANPTAWGEDSANPTTAPFIDSRGSIRNVTHFPVGSVSVIFSRENTSRANHWHREDAHLCYVVSGRVEYYQRPVGSAAPATKFEFIAGQSYYTPPNVEHMMKFPVETVILSLGKLPRTHQMHEDDLVRLEKPLA